jgi:hypothetical protein
MIAAPTTAPAHEEPLRVSVVSSLITVRPGAAIEGSSSARLEAARGEWESFQVVVRAGGSPATVSATAAALIGPRGARLPDPLVSRVALVDLRRPSSVEGAAGPWPDPLIPSVDAYAGERRRAFPWPLAAHGEVTVWIDLFVPRSAKPGD